MIIKNNKIIINIIIKININNFHDNYFSLEIG